MSSSRPLKKVFAEIVQQYIEPSLLLAGFVRDDEAFVRLHPGVAAVVKIERSPSNTSHSFTFHLVLQLFAGELPPETPPTQRDVLMNGYPFYSEPIGPLYAIVPGTDAKYLGARVNADIQRVLPFAARFGTADDAIQFLLDENQKSQTTRYSYVIAIILARIGRTAEARTYFRETDVPRDLVERTAAAYGIVLDDEQ